MAKNIFRSGKQARPKTAVKGKRYLCAKCRKRSPKPVKTPAPWYCPNCLSQKDSPASKEGEHALPIDVRSNAVEVWAKLVAAHTLRDKVNERIGRLTAELTDLCFPTPEMTADEESNIERSGFRKSPDSLR